MQQMITGALVTILALTPASVDGFRSFRRQNASLAEDPAAEVKDPIAEVKKKWDGMDDVLEILFVIACRSKHQKDVHGAATHKMKQDGLTTEEFNEFMQETQNSNVQDLTQACGQIVATHQKKCRLGCSSRWNENLGERKKCDDACVEVYTKFESRCHEKAEDLGAVYKAELENIQKKQTCLVKHCEEFPATYTMEDADKQNAHVEEQCEKRCTDERIEKLCKNQFVLKADMISANVGAECFKESTVKTCVDDKVKEASGERDSCKSGKEAKCASQYDECLAKGPESETKSFCDQRKKICLEQVTEGCASSYKEALDKGRKTCEASDKEGYGKCMDENMATAEEESVKACQDKKTKSCPADCKKMCNVEHMNTCLAPLSSNPETDPTEFFCSEMWDFLHSSSAVDPVTGNPIVLLDPNRHTLVTRI